MIYVVLLIGILLAFIAMSGMIRALPFYASPSGATSAALTFIDPVSGATVTKIPQADSKRGVALVAAVLGIDDADAAFKYASITVGDMAEYEKLRIPVMRRNDTPQYGAGELYDLGGRKATENDVLSGTYYGADGDHASGVLYYDDMEPSVPIPDGPLITVSVGGAADGGTSLSVTGATVNETLGVNSKYGVIGAYCEAEDATIQAAVLYGVSGKHAAVAFPGWVMFPACAMVIDGSDVIKGLLQVQVATKCRVNWLMVEMDGANTAKPVSTKIIQGAQKFLRFSRGPVQSGGGSFF